MVRMRTTRGKRNMRRAQHRAVVLSRTTDGEGQTHIRHHASRDGGRYRSRSVFSVERRAARLKKKAEQRAARGEGDQDAGEKRTTEQATVGS